MQQTDHGKVEEVRKYLARRFPASRLDDYARGSAAHLFTVREAQFGAQQPKRHNLVVTRQFFERFPDAISLKDALESGEVGKSLERAGERTVELY
jgi:hypothetical protein